MSGPEDQDPYEMEEAAIRAAFAAKDRVIEKLREALDELNRYSLGQPDYDGSPAQRKTLLALEGQPLSVITQEDRGEADRLVAFTRFFDKEQDDTTQHWLNVRETIATALAMARMR